MATQFDTQLQQLYVAYFNRPADPAGLAFYADKLATNATTIEAISASFAASAEYKAAYNQTTFTGVVTAVYQNLFGHAPDQAGLTLYADALANGSMTVAQMVTWISNGALGADKIAYDSKVQVAVAFTNALDTEAEATAYNNADAQAAAKEMLSGIKTAAQATAAVEPTALDAAVAAVIKAGTPFSLESGLAALGAAQEARAEFLEEQDTTVAAIGRAVDTAEAKLAEQIDNDAFANASTGVQAALIADQTEYNADALEAANDDLEDAQEAVAEVDGLADAIVTMTAAEAAVEEADDAAEEATDNYDIAVNTFQVRTGGTVAVTAGDLSTLSITNDDAEVIASFDADAGVVVLADDVDATAYTGLQALIDAANASLAADAEASAAADAYLIAQLQVAILENADSALVEGSAAGQFDFTVTTPGTTITFSAIADELAAVAASGNTTAYTNFVADIQAFIDANDTVLADAVVAAEQGGLAQAQAAVAAVPGLRQALALRDADLATTAAADDVTTDLDINTTTGVVTFDNGTTVENIAVIGTGANAGKLVLADDVDAADYDGLAEYIAAFNAEVDALAAYNATSAADGAGAATALIGAQTGAGLPVTLLAAQEAAIELAPANTTANATAYAAYIAALGVNGAQDRVDGLAEAVADLEEAQAVATELASLNAAVKAAEDDFAAHDFNAPVNLGLSAFGRTGTDIFVVDVENTTITTSTIANFGRSGDDVLYVGSGYTLNEGDVTKAGNAGVMEVFFTQQGNNTIVTIEKESYGSNTNSELIKVTLTGVDADDLSFENGIISL
jgi:hypothetical protein